MHSLSLFTSDGERERPSIRVASLMCVAALRHIARAGRWYGALGVRSVGHEACSKRVLAEQPGGNSDHELAECVCDSAAGGREGGR